MKIEPHPLSRPPAEPATLPLQSARSFDKVLKEAGRESSGNPEKGGRRPGSPLPAADASGSARLLELGRIGIQSEARWRDSSGSTGGPGLEPSAIQSASRWRAFGFGELGMFGVYGARLGAAGEPLQGAAPGLAAMPADPLGTNPNVEPRPADRSTTSQRPRVVSGTDMADPLGLRLLSSGPISRSSSGASFAAAEREFSADAAEIAPEEGFGGRRDPRALARLVLARAGLGVSAAQVRLTGPTEALRVAVSVAGLPPEAFDRLRSLFEETLSEHGMALLELTVNGSPVAARLTPNGAANGPRAD